MIHILLVCMPVVAYTQVENDTIQPIKLVHAEPLYIDLIRDLGARKGEREWNVGLGMTDKFYHDKYIALVEYEWAIANRLGLEVEVPFSIYTNGGSASTAEKPSDRIESLKTAIQWTFLVSPKAQVSMALGYINELEFRDLNQFSKGQRIIGNVFNPFFVGAKRLGSDWHSLVYAGTKLTRSLEQNAWENSSEINTSFHYMIPGTRNFVGVEFNKVIEDGDFSMVIRPQMRLVIHDSLMVGIVPGIPLSKDQERLSSFIRLIYEPQHKKKTRDH